MTARRVSEYVLACAHDFAPVGFFEGYPLAECRDCNAGALYDVPGRPPVLEFLLARLEALGLEPRPVTT